MTSEQSAHTSSVALMHFKGSILSNIESQGRDLGSMHTRDQILGPAWETMLLFGGGLPIECCALESVSSAY